MRRGATWLGVAGGCTGMLLGCRGESTSDGHGEKVTTPCGGVQIRTNQAAAESGIGMPVYPGATLVTKDKDDKDNG